MRFAAVRVAVLGACLGLVAPLLQAQNFVFQRDCAQWIEKKGYSTDYIQLRTGKRQRGMADNWRGNVEPKDVQAGDVVMTIIPDKGRLLHASFVEEVRRNADGSAGMVVVSEWNEGRYVDERCFATDHFGRTSGPRVVPLESIVRVWRPSLPIRGAPPE